MKTLDIQPDPTDMVLYSPESRIYLSHGSGMISVIDTESQTIVEVFRAGVQINSLALTPDQSPIFASDNGSSKETAINSVTGNISRFTSGMNSYSCAVSGNGSRLFLSCQTWNIIGVMDIETLTMEGTISCTGSVPDSSAWVMFPLEY